MRELARNIDTGYLFPNRDNLNRITFEVVKVPDNFVGERLDDYGNAIGHGDNPRDDTSDAVILSEEAPPVKKPKQVTKKVAKKKVAKKKAAQRFTPSAVPAIVDTEPDLFDGID